LIRGFDDQDCFHSGASNEKSVLNYAEIVSVQKHRGVPLFRRPCLIHTVDLVLRDILEGLIPDVWVRCLRCEMPSPPAREANSNRRAKIYRAMICAKAQTVWPSSRINVIPFLTSRSASAESMTFSCGERISPVLSARRGTKSPGLLPVPILTTIEQLPCCTALDLVFHSNARSQ
jgi:hypothetical protein